MTSGSADDETFFVGQLSVASGPRGDRVTYGSFSPSLEPILTYGQCLSTSDTRLIGQLNQCGKHSVPSATANKFEDLLARVRLKRVSRLTHSASALAAGRDTTQKEKIAREELLSPQQQFT